LEESIRGFIDSVRFRVLRLTRRRGYQINIDVFSNPEKYFVRLPIEKVVADSKVSREGVEGYKRKIKNGEKIGLIIVVKHPKLEKYAVLDGHHRYFALLESGKKKIDCALAGDLSSVIFYMTKHGYFQPDPRLRKGIQKQTLKFHDNIQEFLDNFSKTLNTSEQEKKESEAS
jgi:hypothetical protein